jgi:hypothetical protein
VSHDDAPTHAPRPGDPRDPGPRPPGRPRDVAWLGLAVVLVTVTAVQFLALARAFLGGGLPPLGTGGLLLAFAFTVVWLLTIAWVTLGAWRRSVWGCPFAHRSRSPEARRCPRHGLVDRPALGLDHTNEQRGP